ncbi:DUF6801 domain-containing protein [Nocardioides mangrovi]|uniref:DUF6801 domain-containing protein n=1 Tax=Nocardioides mangrovi TaxID=2874580 RepID=A0ABS7U8D3_9ACTN|nr:DUF6801 domain-containing protein [Nocardioides mangrovi]MBZ5737238.1 hypothetical protein [Nocardioides mangrovi]
MNTHVRTTRLAAFGAATALVAGGVVAAAPAAEAKPASLNSSYTCTTALGDQTLGVTIKIDLPTKVKKGSKVAARPVNMKVKLPETLVTPMRDILGITAISGSASKIKYAVGSMKVPLSKVKIPQTDVPDSGGMTLKAKGIANGFKAPKKPGSYVVSIPKAFTFNALNQDGQPVPTSPFPCAVADGAPTKLGTLKVTK